MRKIISLQTIFLAIVIFPILCLHSCQAQKKKSYTLSKEDKQKYETIIKFSMSSMDTVSLEMHTLFWKIVDENGGNPDNIFDIGSKEQMINHINNNATFYQRAFYKDALVSFKTGKPFKSEEREMFEEKNETIGQEQIQKSAELMQKIANKNPIPYNGTEIVMDDELINSVLENLDMAMNILKHNLDILYSKPYKK